MSDSRLDVYTTAVNRGAYYCRQLMLLADPHEWHAPVDADDCLSPTHLETMLRHGCDAIAPNRVCGHVGGRCEHRGGRDGRVYGAGRYHVGLFTTRLLRSVGGYDPSERLGGDTLLLRLLRMAYPGIIRTLDDPAYLAAPTYHRTRQPGSLTRDPATAHGSPARAAMQSRNRQVYRKASALETPARIARWRTRHVPPAIAAALEQDVHRLSARLGRMEAVA